MIYKYLNTVLNSVLSNTNLHLIEHNSCWLSRESNSLQEVQNAIISHLGNLSLHELNTAFCLYIAKSIDEPFSVGWLAAFLPDSSQQLNITITKTVDDLQELTWQCWDKCYTLDGSFFWNQRNKTSDGITDVNCLSITILWLQWWEDAWFMEWWQTHHQLSTLNKILLEIFVIFEFSFKQATFFFKQSQFLKGYWWNTTLLSCKWIDDVHSLCNHTFDLESVLCSSNVVLDCCRDFQWVLRKKEYIQVFPAQRITWNSFKTVKISHSGVP